MFEAFQLTFVAECFHKLFVLFNLKMHTGFVQNFVMLFSLWQKGNKESHQCRETMNISLLSAYE